MKLVRDNTPKRAGPRRAAPSRVARKVLDGRTPGANHLRVNATLERQADEAADMVVRGQKNVGRVITPAPPAKYEAPSSAGETLARPVKTEMEDAFGADFGEVRVHRDGASHSAARREQAKAFTAGRDIFFGEGHYDPDRGDGKRLLAHELAHVLQQTGRRTTNEMIYATARVGSGDIQMQPDDGEATFVAPRRCYGTELACLRTAPLDPPSDDGDGNEDEERKE
jgi:hypothetical protein